MTIKASFFCQLEIRPLGICPFGMRSFGIRPFEIRPVGTCPSEFVQGGRHPYNPLRLCFRRLAVGSTNGTKPPMDSSQLNRMRAALIISQTQNANVRA